MKYEQNKAEKRLAYEKKLLQMQSDKINPFKCVFWMFSSHQSERRDLRLEQNRSQCMKNASFVSHKLLV